MPLLEALTLEESVLCVVHARLKIRYVAVLTLDAHVEAEDTHFFLQKIILGGMRMNFVESGIYQVLPKFFLCYGSLNCAELCGSQLIVHLLGQRI